MDIMEQQQKLLQRFGRLNDTYEPLTEPVLIEIEEEFFIDSDRLLTNGESTIRFPAAGDLIDKVRNFNKQLQGSVKKLRWAASGKDKMEVLIGHLVHFNDKLDQALDKAQRTVYEKSSFGLNTRLCFSITPWRISYKSSSRIVS